MQTITTIGLDIAKSVFQVHGVDAAGARRLLLGLERTCRSSGPTSEFDRYCCKSLFGVANEDS
jgi:hypothetical protein